MKSGFRIGSPLCVALGLLAVPAISQAQEYDPISETGGEAIRSISFDLCLPADGHEYEALGKNAIIMLTSSTAIAPELPLKSVFVEIDGNRVPLQRIARAVLSAKGDRIEQVSFYLVSIQLTKKTSRLAADFQGARSDFGIGSFGPEFYPSDAPAFVRLDEYDNPSEPDPDVLAALLAREYPAYFAR